MGLVYNTQRNTMHKDMYDKNIYSLSHAFFVFVGHIDKRGWPKIVQSLMSVIVLQKEHITLVTYMYVSMHVCVCMICVCVCVCVHTPAHITHHW